jgi:hypothetical protein
MSKPFKPGKTAVELRPSRIRRDPIRVQENDRLATNAWWDSREWEIRFAIAGIIFFALALCALVIDIGHVLGF